MKMIKLNKRNEVANLRAIVPSKDKLCISAQEGQIIIPKIDVFFLRADGNYCFVHYGSTKIMCSQNLKSIESRIQMPNFLKTHKSFVVNFDKVKSIDNSFSTIVMDDGTKVPIARSKKQLVKAMILKQFD